MNTRYIKLIEFIKTLYPGTDYIPLHAPIFVGNERRYVLDAIDSTYVSSVGAYVNKFEEMMCEITGAKNAIAMVNGTNALHMGLLLADVIHSDEVISQSLTFIATVNAISYIGATPVFIDVDIDSMGMSPKSLSDFLMINGEIRSDGFCYNKTSKKRIKACVPMHTFGSPCRIDEIAKICAAYNISLVEDAAESLGSFYKERHTGVFGKVGVFSFNGNKTVTSGGGGALITDDPKLAKRAKHLSTQAKVPHAWAFIHDEVGYNYRMPNLNAALACAQLEQLNSFVEKKRVIAANYQEFSKASGIAFTSEIEHAKSNYWLNCILLDSAKERDEFLKFANENGVMSRPVWELMHRLPMFEKAQTGDLSNSKWLADRLVNIPSSVIL
jgi:aminotransferase in exopolysaccharide biosynthesis